LIVIVGIVFVQVILVLVAYLDRQETKVIQLVEGHVAFQVFLVIKVIKENLAHLAFLASREKLAHLEDLVQLVITALNTVAALQQL